MHDKLYLKAWKRLPERFRKPTNKDLYYVLYGGFDEVEQGFLDVKDSRNINKATGETLDRMGANVGQFRQGEDDELYRQLIKVRIIANMSIGDIPTINLVMSTLVKDVYLGLQEVWNNGVYDNEPAAIILGLTKDFRRFPFEVVQAIKAAGVRILCEIRYVESLIYKDKTDTYKSKFWLVNEVPCGRVPEQAYKGKRFVDRVSVGNTSSIKHNRPYQVNEIKSGGVANK